MKKIKRIWEENKVLLVLTIILIICLTVVVIVTITYFYGTSTSVYGNRLENAEKVPINKSKLDSIKGELEAKETVKSASSLVKGNIVYMSINFVDNTKMDDAKKEAEAILELFSEEELNTYDLNITISSLTTETNPGYTLMGAKNANGSDTIVWNNYTLIEESAE